MGKRWMGLWVLCLVGLLACGSDDADATPDAGTSSAGGSGGSSAGGAGGSGSGGSGSGGAGGGGASPTAACPDAVPEVGSACESIRGTCAYDAMECDCVDETSVWACWDPSQCPTEAPQERASCDLVGMRCSFGDGAGSSSCDCTGGGWDCGGQYCPEAQPAAGESCERGPGDCTYADLTCDCSSDTTWACWDPMNCPTTPPDEGATCSTHGMRCPYGRGRCECDQSTGWECNSRVERDTDAGMPEMPDIDAGG